LNPAPQPRRRIGVVALSAVVGAVAACSIAPPSPVTPRSLEEAVTRTAIEAGIDEPRQVLRADGWVLVTGTRGPNDVLLLLSATPDAPWSVSVVHESAVRVSDPATLSYATPEDTVYLFGLVNDPRIASLEVAYFDGDRRTFGVAPPGYLVERPGAAPPDPIRAWRFRDATGAVIFDPATERNPSD
jgi:hypothetical protein